MKRVEKIETPDDFGRKIELKPDNEIDISKSSYKEWLKQQRLNGSTSSGNEHNDDLSVLKEEESSEMSETIDMKNTVASEIEVDHEANLLKFSEEDICEHYANLAMHNIAAFSNEFKSEERVQRLKKILTLLEEDKDEVLRSKKGNDHDCDKGDMVEGECKEAEMVEAECKEAERVEAECKKEAERVEAECKKETERVEGEGKEAKIVEAECKEAEPVEAECKEAERVEAECKTEEEHKKVFSELCKENPVDKKQRNIDREMYLAISKRNCV